MDWDFNKTSVIMVGAGFSAAVTLGKSPLMVGFFDELKEDEYPELFAFVKSVGCNRVCSRIEQANVETVLLSLEQIHNTPDSMLFDWLVQWRSIYDKLQTQVSHYTIKRFSRCKSFDTRNWAVQCLAKASQSTTVISMNYDNIADQILSNRPNMIHACPAHGNATCPHCKMRILLNYACNCNVIERNLGNLWKGALIKPHGSIAWKRCVNKECCSYQCLVADQHCKPFEPCHCPNCGKDCHPALVMPTMSKNLALTPEICTMWEASRLAFLEAESIAFFGFSLPTSDELLIQLIRNALSKNSNLKRVCSIDLNPEGVLSRFDQCLPVGATVEKVLLKAEINATPEWFDRLV